MADTETADAAKARQEALDKQREAERTNRDMLPVVQVDPETVVTRQQGLEHSLAAGGQEAPLLPVNHVLDPDKQPEALGSPVTRQRGNIVVDAQTAPGTFKADVPSPTAPPSLLADRARREGEPTVQTVDGGVHSYMDPPISGGTVDVERVKSAVQQPDEFGNVNSDKRAPGTVQFAPGTPGLSEEKLAEFREGRHPGASQPAGSPGHTEGTVLTAQGAVPASQARGPREGEALPQAITDQSGGATPSTTPPPVVTPTNPARTTGSPGAEAKAADVKPAEAKSADVKSRRGSRVDTPKPEDAA